MIDKNKNNNINSELNVNEQEATYLKGSLNQPVIEDGDLWMANNVELPYETTEEEISEITIIDENQTFVCQNCFMVFNKAQCKTVNNKNYCADCFDQI